MIYLTDDEFSVLMHLIVENHAWGAFYDDVVDWNPKDIFIRPVRVGSDVMYIRIASIETPNFGLNLDDRWGELVEIYPEHPLWSEHPIHLTNDQRTQYISMLDDMTKMIEI